MNFRADFLQNKGDIHNENASFGLHIVEIFPWVNLLAFVLSPLSRKSAWKPVRGVFYLTRYTVIITAPFDGFALGVLFDGFR